MKRAAKAGIIGFFLVTLAVAGSLWFWMENSPLPAAAPGMSREEIDALRYPGRAWSLRLRAMMKAGPRILPADFDTGLPPPPANDSDETKADLRALHEMARTGRTELQLMRIKFEDDATPMQIFAKHELVDLHDRPVNELAFYVVWDVTYFLVREKDKYARPRPTQLDPALTTVIPVPRHPSYPNGNAGQAYAVALVMGMLEPAKKDEFEQLALDVGHRREIAGLHFPGDTAAGRLAAKNVVDALLKTEKIQSLLAAARKEHPEWEKKP